MSVLRYAVPAAMAVAGAAAASSCSAATTTIQNQGDASALASCTVFTGSIALATGVSDIAINGVQEITGSLIATDVSGISSLSGDSLVTIGDTMELNGLTQLTSLSFPLLTKVDNIDWMALPVLSALAFTTGVSEVSSVTIQNTQLASLDGINLEMVEVLMIQNNPYLNTINMQLGNVTQALTISANGDQLMVSFPNLIWAFNMTLWNCSDIMIPSLASVNGSLGFHSNGFSSFTAPNLTTVGGSLAFVSNPSVTNISLPQLTAINGGFQVANNTDLNNINGFPSLKTVGGALDFNGDFKNVTLPALKTVRGAFNLQSSDNITSSCAYFKTLKQSSASPIQGTYTCHSTDSNPQGVNGKDPSGTSDSGDDSQTSSGAAVPMLIPGATGLLGVVAAIFGLL